MKRNQVGARHVAWQKGGSLPPSGKRVLRDGTLITGIQIDPTKDQGVVTGVTKNGGQFLIAVPLTSLETV